MFKSFLKVPLLMGCALVGTVGLMGIIKKFCPEQFSKVEENSSEPNDSEFDVNEDNLEEDSQ